MINKLKTALSRQRRAFDNYMVGYRERGEQIKASNEKALLEHRLKRGMASELSKRLDVNTNMGVSGGSRNNEGNRQQDSLRRDEFRRSYNDEYQRRLNKLRKTK